MRLSIIFWTFILLISCQRKESVRRNLADDLKHSTFGGLKVIAVSNNCSGRFATLTKVRPDGMGFTTDTVTCANLEDSLKRIGRTFDGVYQNAKDDQIRSCDGKVPAKQIVLTWLFNVYQ